MKTEMIDIAAWNISYDKDQIHFKSCFVEKYNLRIYKNLKVSYSIEANLIKFTFCNDDTYDRLKQHDGLYVQNPKFKVIKNILNFKTYNNNENSIEFIFDAKLCI